MNRFTTIAASFFLFASSALADPSSAAMMCERLASHPWEPGRDGRSGNWQVELPAAAISACRTALAEDPSSPVTMFRLARALIQEQFADEGRAMLLRSARAGYAPAQAEYAAILSDPRSGPTNRLHAREWLEKAALQGHVPATYSLAYMLHQGFGVDRDMDRAGELYLRAASSGYVPAMQNLGIVLAARGDFSSAVAWYRRAADAGNPISMTSLGDAYSNGRGVTRDDAAALEWYTRTALEGEPLAQTKLGVIYGSGVGSARDRELGRIWMRRAAEQYYPRAMKYLGQSLIFDSIEPSDDEEGIEWLQRAGAYGELEAYAILAEHYMMIGDLLRAREHAEVVLLYDDRDLRQRAQDTLNLVRQLELERDVRAKDGYPFKTTSDG